MNRPLALFLAAILASCSACAARRRAGPVQTLPGASALSDENAKCDNCDGQPDDPLPGPCGCGCLDKDESTSTECVYYECCCCIAKEPGGP